MLRRKWAVNRTLITCVLFTTHFLLGTALLLRKIMCVRCFVCITAPKNKAYGHLGSTFINPPPLSKEQNQLSFPVDETSRIVTVIDEFFRAHLVNKLHAITVSKLGEELALLCWVLWRTGNSGQDAPVWSLQISL